MQRAVHLRQTIGISMGTDCAPQLANLFLFHYEYSYMKQLMKDNLCMAKQFSDTVRYIDDLLTLNNRNFEGEIMSMYPSELKLRKTTEIYHIWTYQLACVTTKGI